MPTGRPIQAETQKRDPAGATAAVVQGVIEDLETGRIAPGQRLAEPDLCLRYAVSRSTAREALQRLESEGVAELSRNRGARVREITLDEALQTLSVTELLVGLMARQAAERCRADAEARLRVQLTVDAVAQARAADDERAFVQARRSFYGALLEVAGNAELSRASAAVQVHVLRAQFRPWLQPRRLLAEYQDIGATVIAGDAPAAEAAARAHVKGIGDTLRQRAD